jgi:hypothetical protein
MDWFMVLVHEPSGETNLKPSKDKGELARTKILC